MKVSNKTITICGMVLMEPTFAPLRHGISRMFFTSLRQRRKHVSILYAIIIIYIFCFLPQSTGKLFARRLQSQRALYALRAIQTMRAEQQWPE
jgi:hypothetical protein